MNKDLFKRFSEPVTVFNDRHLPEPGIPAGYAMLKAVYKLDVPLQATLYGIGLHHRIIEGGGWRLYTPRHAPKPTLKGHLIFALRYEGLELGILKKLFRSIGPDPLVNMISAEPTGGYVRRMWFLYEWLTGDKLDLPDAGAGRYVNVVNPEQQFCLPGTRVWRHRVIDNLPGSPMYCPMVSRTNILKDAIAQNLIQKAQMIIDDVPRDLLSRTAAFLLIKDSKSSYAIEGEQAPINRIQRWGHAIGEAGRNPLSKKELFRLQKLVIGDSRFVRLGFRDEGGFVGSHDRGTGMALPEHISARHQDLEELMEGLIRFSEGAARLMDPVIAAAVLAFGFIYIHPFVDGNGRLHRYLIHHVLTRAGFNPTGLVFTISATILARIEEYREVLEGYSRILLPLIDWEPLENGNVTVRNTTGDYYRFFNATAHAEFLYSCVKQTIEKDLPEETEFLRRHDRFKVRIETIIDMPNHTFDLLFRFLSQNGGKLSKQAREQEFRVLTAEEVYRIEDIYSEEFPERELS
ncbi:Fic family protein [bacterium]|nr:Fic family protein [bacterium]